MRKSHNSRIAFVRTFNFMPITSAAFPLRSLKIPLFGSEVRVATVFLPAPSSYALFKSPAAQKIIKHWKMHATHTNVSAVALGRCCVCSCCFKFNVLISHWMPVLQQVTVNREERKNNISNLTTWYFYCVFSSNLKIFND